MLLPRHRSLVRSAFSSGKTLLPAARSSRSGWNDRPPSTAVARPSASRVGAYFVRANQRDVYACVSSCASICGIQDSLPASAGPSTPMSRVHFLLSRRLDRFAAVFVFPGLE